MNSNLLPEILFASGVMVSAYLIGSIPVCWLVARLTTGQDLRRMGSGNVGVMNTALSVARWAGLIAFAGEISKGVLAVVLPPLLGDEPYLVGLAILGVVTGTRWPVWLGFKGGRGNTAGLSACLLVYPDCMLLLLGIWLVVRILFNRSFIATRLALFAFPLVSWGVSNSLWFTLTAAGLSLLYLHAQQPTTDDHLLLNQQGKSVWGFLLSPLRRNH